MLFEQDDKLCKQYIKSFEQHIKLKNKTRMPLPGFRRERLHAPNVDEKRQNFTINANS